ncbi:DUF2490 domain-containing protein [Psychroserpens burtonensis]|uniref:DUF2490 domain-containing protein n=1 Tax=Psychroserpens burtonensis TaxID=49278 RepID=A0A5C7B8X6_9FLAO|nr:DUF2490 domain-containing protein [Psychroserpens burtonensis]TXE18568.1 DUF2490 domain-containing protein [Psychroserpens burtonensis]
MKNIYIAFLLILVFNLASAQENSASHSSSWNSFIPKVKIDNSFYITSEFHFRRANFLKGWEQFIIRPAIHFKKNETYDFALGYSFIKNYSFADFSIPINANEHNIWQQVQLSQSQGKISFKHRFRLEERFIDKIVESSNNHYGIGGGNYNNRFRYRFTVTRPIIKIKEDKSISVEIFNELFMDLEDGIRPKAFNQNWFYVGLGYPITSKMGLGIGYHNIGLNGGNNTFITNHILQTTITYLVN